MLGTFITEWDKGRAACDVLLSSKESAHLYAERLTELAVALGFDGWLVMLKTFPSLYENERKGVVKMPLLYFLYLLFSQVFMFCYFTIGQV